MFRQFYPRFPVPAHAGVAFGNQFFMSGRHGRRDLSSGGWGDEPRTRRGDMKFILLGLLFERPQHGYELMKELETRRGDFRRLELIMTWSMFLAVGDITTAVARSRKVAPASLVVRGSVQLVAAIATQLRSFTATELATVSVDAWQHVRADLEQHQRKRVQQRQFRSDPATYLASLEQKLLQLVLPI